MSEEAQSYEEMWIGPQPDLDVDDTGFLIEFSNPFKQQSNFVLRDTPAYTNQSHEPQLTGWCGSHNDVSTNAHGFWIVIKTAKNGRAKIRRLSGDALRDGLELFGFPDLYPEV